MLQINTEYFFYAFIFIGLIVFFTVLIIRYSDSRSE